MHHIDAIGAHLRESRTRQGLSLGEVAHRAGVNAGQLRTIESHLHVVSLDFAAEIARAYGKRLVVTVEDLVPTAHAPNRLGKRL